MNILNWIKVLYLRFQLNSRSYWTVKKLAEHQKREVEKLRTYAYANSPFYKKFHLGLEKAPLEQLPIITKSMLMENWNEIVTDKTLTLKKTQDFLFNNSAFDLLNEKYAVCATGGTSGKRGIFAYNLEEWIAIITSYIRANDWAGMKLNLLKKLKIAVVSTTTPWHQSARVGATLNSPASTTLRLDSTSEIQSIVEKLNYFQPEVLVAYANMNKTLAQEQLRKKLDIKPKVIFCSSEVLTYEAKKQITAAFKVEPFNVYAATETATIATECTFHKLHLCEDLVLIEVVNENNKPIKLGKFGSKILATVLFSRTLPLIRYEITDRVKLSTKKCNCKKPFSLIAEIEGRKEDVLSMQSKLGQAIQIHPNVFHNVLEKFEVGNWQAVQKTRSSIDVLITTQLKKLKVKKLKKELLNALLEKKVYKPKVSIKKTTKLQRSKIGKTQLIKALKN